MDTKTIIILVAAFFLLNFLITIVILSYNKKKKKSEKNFIAQNKDVAILYLYCDNVLIDGNKITSLDYMKGQYGQYIVSLQTGKHLISANYSTTTMSVVGNNKNWKSAKIDTTIDVKAGYQYEIGIFEYSAQQRSNYYGEQEPRQCVSEQILTGDANDKFYILCYENEIV